MKTKNFLILVVLLSSMFLTGCDNVGKEEIQKIQEVSTNFLNETAYCIPDGYNIQYTGKEGDFYVEHGRLKITFDKCSKIISMTINKWDITKEQINKFKQIRNDFLSTKAYKCPTGYEIEKTNDQITIKKNDGGDHVQMTFNLEQDENIIGVAVYNLFQDKITILLVILIVILMIAFIKNL